MAKFMIVSHRGDAGRLLESLQQAGICQILNADAAAISKEMKDLERGGERPRDIEETLGLLARGVDFLKSYSKPAAGLSAILAPKAVVDKRTYEQVTTDEAILKVAEQCSRTKSAIEKLKSEIDNLNSHLAELRPWERLDVIIGELSRLKQTRCWLGFVPIQCFEQLEQDLAQAGAVIQSVGHAGTKNTCVIVALKDAEEQTGKLLRSAGFEHAELDDVTGTAAEAMSEITDRLKKAEEALAGHRVQAESLTKHLLKLEILYDYYSNLLNREQTEKSAPATKQTIILEGWVRRNDFSLLEKIVGRFSASSLHNIAPAEDEQIPVEIENTNVIRPFEAITRLYGMPQHFNIDPTVFLAPFFIVFFAMCLADTGYGLMMVAIAGWMIMKMQGDKKLVWMLAICGVSTTIFGALTGGWFGDAIPQFIPALNHFREKLMLFDPLSNPVPFLVLSIGFGYFQINVGIVIALVHDLKRRDFIAAACDRLTWLVMLNSLVLFGAGKFGLIDGRIGSVFGKIAIIPAAAILLFSHRQGGWGERLGMGFYNVFSSVFYLGDVLSYLRLMALGMTGAGLAMAVNIIAKLVMHIPYGIGIILMILILVGGHLFNLAMSALGAFVHTLRLQFVEFFPKFIVGGGKSFEPLNKQYKHIYIAGDEKRVLKD